MLGDLARKLRFLGYDTLYVGEMELNETRDGVMDPAPLDDGDILHAARAAGRLVLTKDVAFASRGHGVLLLEGNDVKQHLAKLEAMLGIRFMFDQARSRCFKCNVLLVLVPKDAVRNKVQANTLEAFDTFYQCPACEQVFWKGAHFRDGNGGFLAQFNDPTTGDVDHA